MAFNVEFTEFQLLNEKASIPKRKAGNVVRAIFHNTIPAKSSVDEKSTRIEFSVCAPRRQGSTADPQPLFEVPFSRTCDKKT